MKTIRLIILLFIAANSLHAQDYGLYWKYKDYDGAIAVSVPRWATFVGSAFIEDKTDRQLVRKVRKVRVLFFEDQSPFSQRDMKRFSKKAHRRHLDELLTVRHGKTLVNVFVKERKAIIKKVVLLFNTDEGSGLVTVKGHLDLEDLNKVIESYGKDKKGKKQEHSIPNLPKVPVLRT